MVDKSTDLHGELLVFLSALGYLVDGDAIHGWTARCEARRVEVAASLPTGEMACAVALRDHARRLHILRSAASKVVTRWSSRYLAEAVRELDHALREFSDLGGPPYGPLPSMPAESPVFVTSEQGDVVGRRAWLVEAEDADGPWRQDVRLRHADAIETALEIVRGWVDGGLDVDLRASMAGLIKDGVFYANKDLVPMVRVSGIDVMA